ncbi:MAG: hypothetical protein ACREPY_03420 [Rhodanobacteraceae bacterium]
MSQRRQMTQRLRSLVAAVREVGAVLDTDEAATRTIEWTSVT